MAENSLKQQNENVHEFSAKSMNGMAFFILNSLLILVALGLVVFGFMLFNGFGTFLIVIGFIYACIVGPILYGGIKVLKPNEARVLTLFGKYVGTLKGEGMYFVNPFCTSVGSQETEATTAVRTRDAKSAKDAEVLTPAIRVKKTISLKTMTLNNEKQKINDQLGNPIIIGIVVIWRVTDTAKAVFNVDNYVEYLSIQCDSALRNIVRLYPYDSTDDESANEKSLRGSSMEIADNLRQAIQEKVDIAGIAIEEARITHLAYAPEIAAAMLQRQQASAIVDARQLIVEGAVGMVQMALDQLQENDVVELDDERKAAMVSNLLVVLCGNRDAQPIVNSGSIY